MKTFHHPLEIELQFHDPEGTPITLQVIDLSADFLDEIITRCVLTFSMSTEIYQYVDTHELFNLYTDVRGQLFGGEFKPNLNVEIEAKLDPSFIFDIATKVKTIEALSEHIQSINQNHPNDLLLNTESWFALNVKQSVELPPEFGEGSLKVGYSTSWGD